MLCRRERHLLYFHEQPDASTFRYRVFNPIQTLAAASDAITSASWFSRCDSQFTNRFVDRADAIVICRSRYDDTIAQIITRARARRTPVLYDTDDLMFDTSYVHDIIDTLDQKGDPEKRWDCWFAHIGRLGATLRMCDGAITTNEYLAERIRDFQPGFDVRVVPNFLNRLQQNISTKAWQHKLSTGFSRDTKIHIGYFSGSPSHNRDFAIAADALATLMAEDPRIVLRVVGFLDMPNVMSRHQERIETCPLQDYLNLQRLAAEVEINIAPLQQVTFTNCKSELKYFEAAVVGTVTIATPTYTFRRAISDGENGYLANAQSWYSKLRQAVELVENANVYAEMVTRAHDDAIEKYGWDKFSRTIEAAVFRTERNDDISPPTSENDAAMTHCA
jgi:glycosyltransferase involved in cell wall biosynthesis